MNKELYMKRGQCSHRFQIPFWELGKFGSSVAAVTDVQIKQYIENQTDEPGSFNKWDEQEKADPEISELQSDLSE